MVLSIAPMVASALRLLMVLLVVPALLDTPAFSVKSVSCIFGPLYNGPPV